MSLDAFRNSRTRDTIAGYINNRIGDEIRDIDDPILRDGVGTILDTIVPGIGGATGDYSDNNGLNALRTAYLESLQRSDVIGPSSVIDTGGVLSKSFDWRARLRPKRGGEDQFYSANDDGFNDYLMRPIRNSGGLVWKHTPSIFLSATSDYNSANLQGSNYPINTYISSAPPNIPVTAAFTANDIADARYLLAVMTFLKVCTKSYYGDQAVRQGNYGTPPPVLLFEYLGDHGFNKVPVVVNSYTIELNDDVDYVPVVVDVGQGQTTQTTTYVPTFTNITVNLLPTYTPHKLRRTFDLNRIASGAAYTEGYI